MSSATKGLGKGLDALIPTSFDQSILAEPSEKIQEIELGKIVANPDQPRKTFDEKSLQELADSIKAHGIVQPLVVTGGGSEYRIVAGERRFRAAHLAGLKKVPVIVRSMQQLEELEVALIENVQRVDLSPLEQAVSIERLHDQFTMSYKDIATRLGKAVPTINNTVRLLQLPKEAKEALIDNKISEGHARAILALKDDPAKQQELLGLIQKFGWSVRQAEQYVTGSRKKTETNKDEVVKTHMARTTEETEKLGKIVKSPVTIRRTAKGGRLEIHFMSDEDLERIIKQLLDSKPN